MLEPRETDIPGLFLVFVVLPLVSYFLLGKWSETAKRKEGINLITRAAEEALQVDNMAVGVVMPVMQLPNNMIRQCARCFGLATTRCSQCKSVWYCSGRCQIAHWRQVHKLECQQLVKDCRRSSLNPISSEGSFGRASYTETTEQCSSRYNVQQPSFHNASSDVISPPLTSQTSATTSGMPLSMSGKSIINRRSSEEVSGMGITHSSEDAYLGKDDFIPSKHHANISHGFKIGDGDLRGSLNAFDSGKKYEILNSSTTAIVGTNADDSRMNLTKGEYLSPKRISCSDETKGLNCSSERNCDAGVARIKDNTPLQESDRVANVGTMRVLGMKKSTKTDHQQHLEDSTNRWKKVKMIFPYEEFVKCFQYGVFNMTPRGLVNCGNSCYANAVLQCLTCTKPLIIYLLRQSHSRAGCAKDWCLMCELEQLVGMLRESGGPLSPTNILMYIRSLNSQIGDGSQEDAHEFLRLLVASMQSICLEGFGGEKCVDPRLQDTTFIQHMFGGCLRSKVKCLRCQHESERYENMMDLTLEIFGWVESLEDALTQFTSTEVLDGENMYRCARCAAYVRARKQLKIQEAPNILTIVLKRFQEGNYGKINKCISFPEMLDMIPFMTGTDDIPPLYVLYAVVVHLDTSNASFSGHYISYVKDLQGNWFRVDDTEVQPVELSQVMTEGAYILFYMRSYPRPDRACNGKLSRHQTSAPPKHSPKIQKSSKPEHTKPNHNVVPSFTTDLSSEILVRESRSRPSTLRNYAEFSDAASSDWSLFTSSDDSSFTTESTRDSFSALDHADLPFSSIFQSLYPAAECSSRRTTACSVFPGSKIQTRFARVPLYDGVSNGVHVNYGGEPRKGQPQTSSVQCTI
ncbi:hypothetical protein DH2020_007017 [Rehmannia glutinosa]|uniref:Ubiquitin carboxyl-terminal hydrolase n=1 Tax=Rehmannia glutinosa TaxID=99300 RepID=A0ABR0TWV0_REHGL